MLDITHCSAKAEKLIQKLCSNCRNLDIQSFPSGRDFDIKASPSVVEGANQGCPFCQLIIPRWEVGLYTLSDDIVFHAVASKSSSQDGEEVKVIEGFRGQGKRRELVFVAEEDDPAARVIWRRPPVTTFDADAAFDIARRWIENCVENHPHCSRSSPTSLPTRLIDVGSDDRHPSLYIPQVGSQVVYVALSYCWGVVKQPLILTRSILASKDHNFPLSTLPATLRDVMLICRRLGFQYVWIDALCIVQDSIDAEDWLKESANMSNIYGGASLTIAASAAKSTSDGILSAILPHAERKCAVLYNLGNGTIGTVYVVPHTMKRSLLISKELPEPLETRAWCLQERLLSPRVLKFETTQLAWDCFSVKINANGPMASPSDLSRRARLDWTHIVQDFTGRNLTYASDKLAALSGYAKHVHSLTGDTYLAGLWKNDITHHLLWWIDIRSTTHDSRPPTYLAPSWSWASTTHQCYFMTPPTPLSAKIQVLDASTSTSPTNPFSHPDPSRRAYIKVRGALRTTARSGIAYVFSSVGEARYVALHSTEGEVIGTIYPDSWAEIEMDAEADTPISILHITERYGLLLVPATWAGLLAVVEEEERLWRRIGLLEMWGGDFEEGVVVII